MSRLRQLTIAVAAALLAFPALAEDLVVIVNAEREAQLTKAELARIYLKQRRFWKNSEVIIPVNRNSISEERAWFVRHVFGDDADRLDRYWNSQYFQGVLPPATLASDEAVKRFVASEPLAIGYIAARLVDASVKVVMRISGSQTDSAQNR